MDSEGLERLSDVSGFGSRVPVKFEVSAPGTIACGPGYKTMKRENRMPGR